MAGVLGCASERCSRSVSGFPHCDTRGSLDLLRQFFEVEISGSQFPV
jgi:hypothetical protein